MLPTQWNNDVAQASLAPPASVPERYHELWWYSGQLNSTSWGTTAGSKFVQKGTFSPATSVSSATTLYTLNANWSASTKFAFEIALYINNSGYTAYAALWDMTTNTVVSGSTVSTNSSTFTILRSGQFTLTPGHSYGITVYQSNASYSDAYCDASLIIFS